MDRRSVSLAPLGKLGVVLALAAASCGDNPTNVTPESRELEDNRELFRRSVRTSYRYEFRIDCFCGPDDRAPVRIEVRDGQIQSVVVLEDGTTVERDRWDRYLTVEQVFTTIEEALDENAAIVRVGYDDSLGYPRDVFIDYSEMIADEERGFTIDNLSAIR